MDKEFKDILLPIAIRVASRTIASDLVKVAPLDGITNEERSRVKSLNRENKINSILEDTEYKELKVSDLPGYKGPKSKLFYLDFVYDSSSNNTK